MEVVFVLLPLALLIAGLMLALFIWAVRSGQYDDLDTPAVRILFDGASAPAPSSPPVDETTPAEAAATDAPASRTRES